MKMDFNALVMIDQGTPVTTSLRVAEIFKKRHREVLRAIKNLGCSANFRERNFAPSSQTIAMPNGGARKQPIYEMTKDGFTFLAMGFTGKEADQFKESYIDAFNWMQEELLKRGMTLMQRYNFVSLRFDTRKAEISNSAKNMRSWQDNKPEFLVELNSLEKELQPHLSNLELTND